MEVLDDDTEKGLRIRYVRSIEEARDDSRYLMHIDLDLFSQTILPRRFQGHSTTGWHW